jgi:TPR repeat protein
LRDGVASDIAKKPPFSFTAPVIPSKIQPKFLPECSKMQQQQDNLDMELSSGISAFEAKYFADASKILSPLADQGVPDAQYRMAIMAQNGLGMVENELLAFKYMRDAAESGFPLAQHGLGFMYWQGECVEANGAKAVEWFKKAAEQGMTGSMATLGMMYKEGNGVEKNVEEARKWYKLAGFGEEEMSM